MQGIFEHPALGTVKVVEHPMSRRISACWKPGFLRVVAPRHASRKEILKALDTMTERLLEVRKPPFKAQSIELPDWSVELGSQTLKPRSILVQGSFPRFTVAVGSEVDTDTEEGAEFVNNALLAVGKKAAPLLLLPQARQLADRLGCRPSLWKISHGHRVLGHCNRAGEIALSFINVFLPPELREYIVCHELAHLTYMDHSPRFHLLCDRYLRGREKELSTQLRNYRWPIRR